MKEHEMQEIASIMKRIAIDGASPEKAKSEVMQLRSGFQKVGYCFD